MGYRNGVYVPTGRGFIAKRGRQLVWARFWKKKYSAEIEAYIAADIRHLWDRPPLDEINVQNGILNVRTRQLRPHDPDFLSPVQLPVDYNPRATCLAWERCVVDVFPDDSHQIAYQIPGWLMVPDRSIQKSVLLTGEGGNGKSVYLDGIRRFLGSGNTSAIPLQKLEANRFACARLIGKLANICTDLPRLNWRQRRCLKP